jgi:hypothetical protein
VENGKYLGLSPPVIDSIHDDVGTFDQLPRAGDETRSAHLCERIDLQE